MWGILRLKSKNKNGSTQLSILQSLVQTHYYSTQISSSSSRPNLMADYLINSLGFSKDEAFSASTKVSHLKSTENPISVIGFLKKCNLDNTQIKNIVCSSPKILTTNVDKTLEPRLRIIEELGLSGSDLGKLFGKIVSSSISSTRLCDNISYLRELLSSDEKVIKVIQRSWWLLATNFTSKVNASLSVLKEHGLSDEKIELILLRNPGCLLQSVEWLDATIKKVEPVLGISAESPRFVDGIEIVVSMTQATLDAKFGIFRSFGWLDSEILKMTVALPFCLRLSEDNMKLTLDFLMNKLGYTAAYLSTHPKLIVYSLKRRVIPRYNVLEVLKEKKVLKSKFSLCSVVALSEEKFVKDYVLPFSEGVPHLYETYTKATGYKQQIK
uniref:transcription termination factor MTERF2, chloroplastic-like n=1 Tax=Erigeron canadensis TaxID=72917 RepID=UPI001CB9CB8D|nr:transcription termination factor MTERF2, chloroplastic-like [Erigeron canadensis]